MSNRARRIAKLRAAINDGKPWFMLPSVFASLHEALAHGELGQVRAAMGFAGESGDSTMSMANGVAVIPIRGALRDDADFMVRMGYASSYQLIERDFKSAMSNPDVKAVAFYIDSPGGSAVGCQRLANMIHEAGGKSTVAYTQGMCCSAAFYIAAACDSIYATPDSLVGSIGTIYKHQEMSKMLADFGVGVTTFTNAESPKKGHGSDTEPLSDAAKQTLQEFTDSYGRAFVADVAKFFDIGVDVVREKFGQGDALRADIAVNRGMVTGLVADFGEVIASLTSSNTTPTPVATGQTKERLTMKVSQKVRAQLFALDLIEGMDVSDEIAQAAINVWCSARGEDVPQDEAGILSALKSPSLKALEAAPAANPVQQAHDNEQKEAKLADLRASAKLVNTASGSEVITAEMVMDAYEAGQGPTDAMQAWSAALETAEPAVPSSRVNVKGEGADRFAEHAVEALVYRASDKPDMQISDDAKALLSHPMHAIAGKCLQLSGRSDIDLYGSRELLAEEAMQMGGHNRQTFFSEGEDRRYVQAAGIPFARPGDFPNILSSLANKFLDTIELDDDYAFPEVSAVLPGGLNDFKPAMMINKGVVEELDELNDAGKFEDLGLSEEVLSYLFLRRFGNKWGWTPVLVANDDLNAFAEGMIGLREAWMVTQNRLVVDRYTSTETLLDGNALFADRADTGVGNVAAANNNARTGGAAPSDSEWAAMEVLYADIGGVATGKRVRGTINTCFCPTGAVAQEARRTFMPLNGLEPKQAATTANVGLYRGDIRVIPESELRINSATTWYGLRNPTRLNTATVVRAYFNGFGTAGRRERWYDPTNKTTYISLEGRIAVAVKNWRYAIRNVV